ncbi:hypothetical protein ACFLQV_00450 [Calditrichota bacterium]
MRPLSAILLILLFVSSATAETTEAFVVKAKYYPALFNFRDVSGGAGVFRFNQSETEVSVQSNGSDNYFKRSVLIPGWGQLSAGKKIRGYTYLAAEIALIGSYLFLKRQSGWLEDDYISYARQYADVNGSHSHQFYVDVGNWNTTQEFNEQRLRNREFDNVYRSPQDQWRWTSEENRHFFDSLRLDSDRASQTATLMIGGLFLNHLISAVDASGLGKDGGKLSVKQLPNSGLALSLSIQ